MIQNWEQTTDAGVTHPQGLRAGAVRCGLKTEGDDLALIYADGPAAAAGLFTTNQVQASCVTRSRRVMKSEIARAILCNAGNANCCNGERGDLDNERMAELAAERLGIPPDQVLTASTGVIGRPLPMNLVNDGIHRLTSRVERGPDADSRVARAIMTTDTRPKQIAVSCTSPFWDGPLRIAGVAKGSGMIAPSLGPPHATMFAFLTTDAQIPAASLQEALNQATERTFNRITVDGDTSTNDMVLLLASGKGPLIDPKPGPETDPRGDAFKDFCEALLRVCWHLAAEIARDGEGATKLVEIRVVRAKTEADAVRIARTVAESPLVKTALYGCDPNWGRLLMAAGRAGVEFDLQRIIVKIGDVVVFRNGVGAPFDAAALSTYSSSKEIEIVIDLDVGYGDSTFLSCDYSYDYIRINAEYHT